MPAVGAAAAVTPELRTARIAGRTPTSTERTRVRGDSRVGTPHPATALFIFHPKIGTRMYHTVHILERSMKFSRPLDGRNPVAIIYLFGVP
jgi:hypothetical protein